MPRLLPDPDVDAALAELPGWRREPDALTATYAAPFAVGVDLVARVARIAEDVDHHPDVDVRYDHTRWRLSTHVAHGITRRDVDLAREVAAVAAQLGATAR